MSFLNQITCSYPFISHARIPSYHMLVSLHITCSYLFISHARISSYHMLVSLHITCSYPFISHARISSYHMLVSLHITCSCPFIIFRNRIITLSCHTCSYLYHDTHFPPQKIGNSPYVVGGLPEGHYSLLVEASIGTTTALKVFKFDLGNNSLPALQITASQSLPDIGGNTVVQFSVNRAKAKFFCSLVGGVMKPCKYMYNVF